MIQVDRLIRQAIGNQLISTVISVVDENSEDITTHEIYMNEKLNLINWHIKGFLDSTIHSSVYSSIKK